MIVELRPIREEEFEAWLPRLREEYAQEVVRDYGVSPDQGRRKALAEFGGAIPAGHSVFVIEADGAPVGHLWLVERGDAAEPTLIVYDVDVDEPHRGHGYGRAAMVFAEEEARRRGLSRIVLHVGVRNNVARNLYRSLGFEENSVVMSKPV